MKVINDGVKGCLIPTCVRTVRSRGLCDTRYTGMALKVSKKQYTWEQLEKAGAVLPLKRPRHSNPLGGYLKSKGLL